MVFFSNKIKKNIKLDIGTYNIFSIFNDIICFLYLSRRFKFDVRKFPFVPSYYDASDRFMFILARDGISNGPTEYEMRWGAPQTDR